MFVSNSSHNVCIEPSLIRHRAVFWCKSKYGRWWSQEHEHTQEMRSQLAMRLADPDPRDSGEGVWQASRRHEEGGRSLEDLLDMNRSEKSVLSDETRTG